MSILIKGMEMPKNCPSCPFNSRAWYEDSHLCLASNEQITVNLSTGYDDNCPLVPVPPHGDLIDRDAARETIKPWSPEDERNGCTFDTVKKLMHTMLDRAPTIIPAEEGE